MIILSKMRPRSAAPPTLPTSGNNSIKDSNNSPNNMVTGNSNRNNGSINGYNNINNNRQASRHRHNQTNGQTSTTKEADFFEDFTIENAEGLPIEMRRFRDRVIIVTNIGTFAPNAKAELEGLNNLAHCYGENLAIIGVPSNHFFHEPTDNTLETLAVMEHVRPGNGFRPNPMSFFVTAHGAVNGADQLALFRFLKKTLPLPADDQFSFGGAGDDAFRITWSPVERSDITSDFEKFIIRPDGKPLRRYTGHYLSVNLYHDVARLVEEFSLTAESAHLSSMRFLRPVDSTPMTEASYFDNYNNNDDSGEHKQQISTPLFSSRLPSSVFSSTPMTDKAS